MSKLAYMKIILNEGQEEPINHRKQTEDSENNLHTNTFI